MIRRSFITLFFVLTFVEAQTDTTAIISGVSPVFTVDAANPVTDWLSPNGGETFNSGANVNGSWTLSDDSPASNPISIYVATSPGGDFTTIITDIPDLGSMLFTLPSVNTAFGRIKLEAIDSFGNIGVDYSEGYFIIGNPTGLTDTSTVISGQSLTLIVDSNDPTVDLIAPDGGQSFNSGAGTNITWTATDPSLSSTPITIGLSTAPGRSFSTLASNVANSSPLAVTLPGIDSAYCRIRITAIDSFGNKGIDASQDYFRIGSPGLLPTDTVVTVVDSSALLIVDSKNPVVDLLSPDGQEAILEGTGIPVTWTAADDTLALNPINLFLATSIGGIFDSQTSYISNDGFESITAPNVVTDFARLRVTATDNFGNTGVDESQDYFKIFQTGTGAITGNIRATLAAEGWLHIGLWYPGSVPESDPPDQARDSLYVVLAPGDSVPYSFANLLPGSYTVKVFLNQTGSPTGGHSFCDGAFDFTGDSVGIQVAV
ncbi:MAG: hypothetical protein GXO90_00965, partial [FCB group bacterium]|nr:hypothetical protein [FCB group bacterium]